MKIKNVLKMVGCTANPKNPKQITWMQIGDKPGWAKPVINCFRSDGSVESFPISRKVADVLLEAGFSFEG